MTVTGTNITMIRGDTEAIKISVKDNENSIVPLVEGDIIYFTVKIDANVKEKELQKIVTEFEDGEAIIEIDPLDTKDMRFRPYVYDVQLTRENGDVKTIIPMSKFVIESEVTHE